VTTAHPTRSDPPEEVRAALAARDITLEQETGRGGMAVVWRALDRKHGRPLAVKLLRADAGQPLGADRFLREIQLAAALRHPNIVPIYDSGAVAWAVWYTMPFIAESLRGRLAHDGRLPVGEAVRIARDVADALAYAHARGVVHRDIKPENILLEGGRAMVADFGVAFAMTRAARERVSGEDERLTGPGYRVGTPDYMSPEQASGDGAVDGRSDIFSLGCVLYEMLAGEPPFGAPTAQEAIARRFRDTPVPVRQLRPDVPEPVGDALAKALAPAPDDRFTTAADFARALTRRGEARTLRRARAEAAIAVVLLVAAAASLTVLRHGAWRRAHLDPHRVVVAALSNETGDSALSPVGRKVADWITDQLARRGAVAVVTSATVLPAQHDTHQAGLALDDPERFRMLAEETRAGTIVAGSYYRGDRGLEFHVEIIDANSGRLLRAFGPVTGAGKPDSIAEELSVRVAAATDTLFGANPKR
jgi:serine/threonine-protein kinase